PGSDYVDIIALDTYRDRNDKGSSSPAQLFVRSWLHMEEYLDEQGEAHPRYAIGEWAVENIADLKEMLTAIENDFSNISPYMIRLVFDIYYQSYGTEGNEFVDYRLKGAMKAEMKRHLLTYQGDDYHFDETNLTVNPNTKDRFFACFLPSVPDPERIERNRVVLDASFYTQEACLPPTNQHQTAVQADFQTSCQPAYPVGWHIDTNLPACFLPLGTISREAVTTVFNQSGGVSVVDNSWQQFFINPQDNELIFDWNIEPAIRAQISDPVKRQFLLDHLPFNRQRPYDVAIYDQSIGGVNDGRQPIFLPNRLDMQIDQGNLELNTLAEILEIIRAANIAPFDPRIASRDTEFYAQHPELSKLKDPTKPHLKRFFDYLIQQSTFWGNIITLYSVYIKKLIETDDQVGLSHAIEVGKYLQKKIAAQLAFQQTDRLGFIGPYPHPEATLQLSLAEAYSQSRDQSVAFYQRGIELAERAVPMFEEAGRDSGSDYLSISKAVLVAGDLHTKIAQRQLLAASQRPGQKAQLIEAAKAEYETAEYLYETIGALDYSLRTSLTVAPTSAATTSGYVARSNISIHADFQKISDAWRINRLRHHLNPAETIASVRGLYQFLRGSTLIKQAAFYMENPFKPFDQEGYRDIMQQIILVQAGMGELNAYVRALEMDTTGAIIPGQPLADLRYFQAWGNLLLSKLISRFFDSLAYTTSEMDDISAQRKQHEALTLLQTNAPTLFSGLNWAKLFHLFHTTDSSDTRSTAIAMARIDKKAKYSVYDHNGRPIMNKTSATDEFIADSLDLFEGIYAQDNFSLDYYSAITDIAQEYLQKSADYMGTVLKASLTKFARHTRASIDPVIEAQVNGRYNKAIFKALVDLGLIDNTGRVIGNPDTLPADFQLKAVLVENGFRNNQPVTNRTPVTFSIAETQEILGIVRRAKEASLNRFDIDDNQRIKTPVFYAELLVAEVGLELREAEYVSFKNPDKSLDANKIITDADTLQELLDKLTTADSLLPQSSYFKIETALTRSALKFSLVNDDLTVADRQARYDAVGYLTANPPVLNAISPVPAYQVIQELEAQRARIENLPEPGRTIMSIQLERQLSLAYIMISAEIIDSFPGGIAEIQEGLNIKITAGASLRDQQKRAIYVQAFEQYIKIIQRAQEITHSLDDRIETLRRDSSEPLRFDIHSVRTDLYHQMAIIYAILYAGASVEQRFQLLTLMQHYLHLAKDEVKLSRARHDTLSRRWLLERFAVPEGKDIKLIGVTQMRRNDIIPWSIF
ncbi:MAG: hypothetical protein ABIE84_07155, partial [bacterium]